MVKNVVQAEPIPSFGGNQRVNDDQCVGTGAEAGQACYDQIAESRVVVVAAAWVVALEPVAVCFIEVLADVRLAVAVLAVRVGLSALK